MGILFRDSVTLAVRDGEGEPSRYQPPTCGMATRARCNGTLASLVRVSKSQHTIFAFRAISSSQLLKFGDLLSA